MLQYQHTEELTALISRLTENVAADKIFLLGQSVEGQPVNSIFSPNAHDNKAATGHFLLLLTRQGESLSDDVIQDMLEQRNKYLIPIHLMVYPAKSFHNWVRDAQSFAIKVLEEAPLLYNAGITKVPATDYTLAEQSRNREINQAVVALHRSASFVYGAEVFFLRKDYVLSAFILHQATEHVCLSFLLKNIGLRTGTHNIDKLLRYSTMIHSELNSVFPRNTAEEVELFRLLQKAYIHSRYKDDFSISKEQVKMIYERVKQLVILCGGTPQMISNQEIEVKT